MFRRTLFHDLKQQFNFKFFIIIGVYHMENSTNLRQYYLKNVLNDGGKFENKTFKDGNDYYYENAAVLIRTLLEDVLQWDDEMIKENISKSTFMNNGLGGMLITLFNGSTYKALECAYNDRFKAWELSSLPRNYWNNDTAREATIWLIDEILNFSDEDITTKLRLTHFNENGLSTLVTFFHSKLYDIINNAFPDKFFPWQFSYSPHKYWNKITAKKATIWLINEKLKWNDEEIKANLTVSIFAENGLFGMLRKVFNESPYAAINNAFPGRFFPWELPSVPRNYWNYNTAKEATIWLIEKKLKWSDEMVKANIDAIVFLQNGLMHMLTKVFGGSTFEALENAYPGKYKKNELKGYKLKC